MSLIRSFEYGGVKATVGLSIAQLGVYVIALVLGVFGATPTAALSFSLLSLSSLALTTAVALSPWHSATAGCHTAGSHDILCHAAGFVSGWLGLGQCIRLPALSVKAFGFEDPNAMTKVILFSLFLSCSHCSRSHCPHYHCPHCALSSLPSLLWLSQLGHC